LVGPAGSQFGASLTLSGNADAVAIGEDYYSAEGLVEKGMVQVYAFNGNLWQPLGQSLEGDHNYQKTVMLFPYLQTVKCWLLLVTVVILG